LLRHAREHVFLEELLDRELSGVRLAPEDRSLVQELCYGVTRWRMTLDWLVERQTTQRHPAPAALVLLRLGLYQLFWLDRVPAHAAINETVEAARALDLGAPTGLINAVLRNYAREADATRALLQRLRTQDPPLGWSHPRWLVQRWQPRLSPSELQKLLEWNNTPAPVYARVNTLKADATQLIEGWRAEGVDYDFRSWNWVESNLVFLLRRHPPLERMKTFQKGWFYVQDPSTLLSVRLLDPKPGERILDLCAAPGGKATFIAQIQDNDGRVVAVEPNPKRRARLRDNCERLGADIQVVAPEDPSLQEPFDAVLVDAPCTNTGVLRRRLEARWRLAPGDLDRCNELQRNLLTRALHHVRPGGRVVYSTCSLEPEENEELVRSFLAGRDETVAASRFLHPARDAVDGAFATVIRRD
jgi:16S rRNA (cytosine967-C5)-methyltransferase